MNTQTQFREFHAVLINGTEGAPGCYEVVRYGYSPADLIVRDLGRIATCDDAESASRIAKAMNEEKELKAPVFLPPEPTEEDWQLQPGEGYSADNLQPKSWPEVTGRHHVSYHGLINDKQVDYPVKFCESAAEAQALANHLNSEGLRFTDHIGDLYGLALDKVTFEQGRA